MLKVEITVVLLTEHILSTRYFMSTGLSVLWQMGQGANPTSLPGPQLLCTGLRQLPKATNSQHSTLWQCPLCLVLTIQTGAGLCSPATPLGSLRSPQHLQRSEKDLSTYESPFLCYSADGEMAGWGETSIVGVPEAESLSLGLPCPGLLQAPHCYCDS